MEIRDVRGGRYDQDAFNSTPACRPAPRQGTRKQQHSRRVCALKPADLGRRGEIITKRAKSLKCNRFVLQGPKKWQTVCFVPLMPPPQSCIYRRRLVGEGRSQTRTPRSPDESLPNDSKCQRGRVSQLCLKAFCFANACLSCKLPPCW